MAQSLPSSHFIVQSNGCSCVSYNRACCKHPCSHCLSISAWCSCSCCTNHVLASNTTKAWGKIPDMAMSPGACASNKCWLYCLAQMHFCSKYFFGRLTLAQFITVDLSFQFFVHSNQKNRIDSQSWTNLIIAAPCPARNPQSKIVWFQPVCTC